MCTGKLKTLLSKHVEGSDVNSFHMENTMHFCFGPGSEKGNNKRVAKINALLSTGNGGGGSLKMVCVAVIASCALV